MMRVINYLYQLDDKRKTQIIRFHENHQHVMEKASGSKTKHQAWEGGYLDHIAETMRIAEGIYQCLSKIRPLPFTLDSAIIVLYFHDIEKMWKYSTSLPKDFNKEYFLHETLRKKWGISFSDDEKNALEYVHGEIDYCSEKKMGRLASLCHAADNLSARLWFDEGQYLG